MSNVWLGLFSPHTVSLSVRGGKPQKAFNALAIVMARDHTAIEHEDLGFELGAEIASANINLNNPKLKSVDSPNGEDIADLLKNMGDGFYLLAWGSKKPDKKKGAEHSFMPIKHTGQGWAMCSRRPPYHTLLEFKTLDDLAQAILRRMRAD